MIELQNVSIAAGRFELREISFRIPAGAYSVLMGRTGQGKTTILEALCGLRKVTAGKMLLQGNDVSRWSPAARSFGYVPQDLALFPTLSVRQHLEFALKLRRWKSADIRIRTDELANLLGIDHLLNRSTVGLSGGEAQRVALGRALSFRPAVLLLDEPFSALDESTRSDMYDLLRRVTQATGVTTLHVTHSLVEAETLASQRLVLRDGRVVDETALADTSQSSE